MNRVRNTLNISRFYDLKHFLCITHMSAKSDAIEKEPNLNFILQFSTRKKTTQMKAINC